ncbi:hypothetical protein B296_00019853 [Ensete ventricosum]|uniref:Uncharacterized protein n=1 Tax=Ensete ventricosum TaxID=4639 RepID=A0A426ZIU9_ENSVE|nr:hypothetical protein B296_00019853 [Ensete ventricosum]
MLSARCSSPIPLCDPSPTGEKSPGEEEGETCSLRDVLPQSLTRSVAHERRPRRRSVVRTARYRAVRVPVNHRTGMYLLYRPDCTIYSIRSGLADDDLGAEAMMMEALEKVEKEIKKPLLRSDKKNMAILLPEFDKINKK